MTSPISEEDEFILTVARDVVSELLEKMRVHAKVTSEFGEREDERSRTPIRVNIYGDDLSILIGRPAETLNALQYISSQIISKEIGRSIPLVVDVEGYRTRRTNVAYNATQTWANPLLLTLEQQALIPMFGEFPVELGLSGMEDELLRRLAADARYRRLFGEAFPAANPPAAIGTIVRGLASFIRTLISGTAPYDRWVQGVDESALSASAMRGGRLFFSEQLECFHCHCGFNFAASTAFEGKPFDEAPFHNNGLYNIDATGAYPPDNTGVHGITKRNPWPQVLDLKPVLYIDCEQNILRGIGGKIHCCLCIVPPFNL